MLQPNVPVMVTFELKPRDLSYWDDSPGAPAEERVFACSLRWYAMHCYAMIWFDIMSCHNHMIYEYDTVLCSAPLCSAALWLYACMCG